VDGRYRLDANDGNFYSQSKFEDYVAMLGVSWRFGGKEAAPVVAAAPVAAAAVVAAPKDTDGDGVTDDLDKCPGTPAGTKVDATGCTVLGDADGDGVTDDKDLCPTTPAGTKVNSTGCPEKIVLKGVNFATNSDKLTPESDEVLAKVAAALAANPKVNVNVDGYTDNQGSASYNKSLSQRRANAVKADLVKKGVDANRITARGFGVESPVADNNTAEGRAENRRVELVPIE
jgi:OOP family OmpA-OmpF porin